MGVYIFFWLGDLSWILFWARRLFSSQHIPVYRSGISLKYSVCMDEKYEQTGGYVSTVNRLPPELNFGGLQRSLRFVLYSTVE